MGLCCCCLRGPGPMWPGVSFRPYQLAKKEILQVGEEADPWTAVVRFTFSLASPSDILGLEQPYTHVKVKAPLRTRTYSLTSERDLKGCFHITVKVYRGGRGSGYLDSLQIGEWAEFAKTRTKRMHNFPRVGMIAYGVGITECLLTCRRLLEKKVSVRLLCANRFFRDVQWFLPELKALQDAHPSFSVLYLFSRENAVSSSPVSPSSTSSMSSLLQSPTNAEPLSPISQSSWQDGTLLQGTRVSGPVLRAAFADWIDQESGYLVVGTKTMMRATYAMLAEEQMPGKLMY